MQLPGNRPAVRRRRAALDASALPAATGNSAANRMLSISGSNAAKGRVLKSIVALLVLNAFLSMTNWWPTPFVELDRRLAPEFVLLWVAILLLVWRLKALSRPVVVLLTCAYLLLVIGRYFDTTAPALFGRSINLYWDSLQIPRVLWVTLKSYPLWIALLVPAALLLLIWLIYLALRVSITVAARDAAPYALSSRWALATSAAAVALVTANYAGVEATWPLVSRPVLPTYFRQAHLLATAWNTRDLEKVLPPSPAFVSDLGALGGIDVNLFFIESYGIVAFNNPKAYAQLKPARDALAARIAGAGMRVVSAYVRSTTFAGGSDLAHVSLLTGIDTSDPSRHDLLLTTRRPTLISLFRERGYETHGFYPALTWDWPEKVFYGFDRFTDARDLGYQGPKIGYWSVPDQVALARYEQLNPLTAASRKRFTFFASITSHMPFHPVPPYQADWSRLLSATPFDEAQMAALAAQKVDWLNMFPGYVGMIDYNYRWLAGYLAQPRARDSLTILLGDHQPAANVTGEGASWDVPVHIISSRPEVLARLAAHGFKPGLEPALPRIGAIFDLTRILMDAFDSGAGIPAAVATR